MTLPSLASVFDYDFMRRALLAGVLVALLAATLGVFAVLRGLALISDGLAHISFAGVAIGLVAGFYPLAVALAAAVVGSLGIQLVRERGWVKGDVAIGLFFTTGLAIGVALVSHGQGLTVSVSSYLFGSILAVTRTDLALVIGLSVLLGVVLLALYKELLYVTFDEQAARVSGLPVGAINVFFSAMTAAGVVLASRIVGVLLVSALIIVPAATALQLSRSFRTTLFLSMGAATLAVVVGLYASLAFDVATGAAIALASVSLFLLAAIGRRVVRA